MGYLLWYSPHDGTILQNCEVAGCSSWLSSAFAPGHVWTSSCGLPVPPTSPPPHSIWSSPRYLGVFVGFWFVFRWRVYAVYKAFSLIFILNKQLAFLVSCMLYPAFGVLAFSPRLLARFKDSLMDIWKATRAEG